ncbi:MAG: GntR family transcriptional regulator [Bordetella sp.]|nr:GntR family transcriptional regulator [Bordetella sp.]
MSPASGPGVAFTRVKTPRVFEDVCEQIRAKLSSGELKPGDKLPAERELAVRFGVGRSAIREALRTLEISGIVRLQKGGGGGAFIAEASSASVTSSLQDLMALGHISPTEFVDARVMILGLVIRTACERGLDADFDRVEEVIRSIERYGESGDVPHRAEAALSFFPTIAGATHNAVLVLLVDSLSRILRILVTEKQLRPYRPDLQPVRWKILEHMRARAADRAVAEMMRYLEIVHGSLTGEHAKKALNRA